MNRYLFGAAISCFNHVRLRNQFSRNTFKALASSLTRNLSQSQIFQSQANFTVTFIRPNGDRIKATCKEGDNLLDVVLNNNIEIDGFGACEGTLSCSTCHLVLKQEDYDRISDKPTDEELDMLDLAYSLTDTLGCQIHMTKELDGLEVQIPEGINDVRMEN